MQSDINIYIDGKVEERLRDLTQPESPLKLDKKHPVGFYVLDSKDPALESFFVLCEVGDDINREEPHPQTQEALGFQAKSQLHYGKCLLTKPKANVFKEILSYLYQKSIPAYLAVAITKSGEEFLIVGHNPRTNTTVQGPNSELDVTKLLR